MNTELLENDASPHTLLQRIWWPLIVIIIVALIVRIAVITQPGFQYDLAWNSLRGKMIYYSGLLNIYRVDKMNDYPPIYLSMIGVVADIQSARGLPMQTQVVTEQGLLILLKVFPICGDLALIITAYAWLRKRRWVKLIIPFFLAISPAMILVSAVWGQSDSLMTLFITLAVIALQQDKPRTAWGFFAVAMLTKFQSVILLPVLVVITFRRYGWRAFLISVLVAGAIMGALLLPFAATSGLTETLRPYTGAVGEFPVATVNAFNLWYAVTPHNPISPLPWPNDKFSDSQLLVGPLTYKMVGLGIFALYGLLLVVLMWRTHDQHREFSWAAAFYFGFFMLPTQIHERYFYPAVILIVIGLAQDRRLWLLMIMTTLTLSFNLVSVLDSRRLLVANATLTSVINIGLLLVLLGIVLTRPRVDSESTTSWKFWSKWRLQPSSSSIS